MCEYIVRSCMSLCPEFGSEDAICIALLGSRSLPVDAPPHRGKKRTLPQVTSCSEGL